MNWHLVERYIEVRGREGMEGRGERPALGKLWYQGVLNVGNRRLIIFLKCR